MDEAEVLLATRVVALCLEPVTEIWRTLSTGLDLIAELYGARGNAAKVEQLRRYSSDAQKEVVKGTAKCPRALKALIENIHSNLLLTGNPMQDWLAVRRLCEGATPRSCGKSGAKSST
jgi:hypothetical protein